MKAVSKFVKASHNEMPFSLPLFLIIALFMLIPCFELGNYTMAIFMFVIAAAMLIMAYAYNQVRELMGLYYEDGDFYYRGAFKARVIEPGEIKGVIILPSQGKTGSTGWKVRHPIVIRKFYNTRPGGSFFHSAVYLRNIEPEMREFNMGDLSFKEYFRKQVIFMTVYDNSMIELIKKHNPELKIIDRRFVGR